MIEYYATDHLGSIRVVFDPNGTVLARSDYLPFGEAYAQSGSLPRQRFTGQEHDDETGLEYFNARSLLARTGRFNRPDPLFAGAMGNPQGWNRYAYVGNNPMTRVDPSGMTDLRFEWVETVRAGKGRADPTAGLVTDPWLGYFWAEYFLPPSTPVPERGRPEHSPPGRENEDGNDENSGDSGGGDQKQKEDPVGEALGVAADLCAGFGDTLSLGITAWLRDSVNVFGTSGLVGGDTTEYRVGQVAGVVLSTSLGGLAGGRAAGVKGIGKEFSHWIPARFGGPRTILNGNYVTTAEHALSDPFRYQFMSRVWKQANPMPSRLIQQWNRLPQVAKGTAAGSAYGATGACNAKQNR